MLKISMNIISNDSQKSEDIPAVSSKIQNQFEPQESFDFLITTYESFHFTATHCYKSLHRLLTQSNHPDIMQTSSPHSPLIKSLQNRKEAWQ
jgi:hypothetical protein